MEKKGRKKNPDDKAPAGNKRGRKKKDSISEEIDKMDGNDEVKEAGQAGEANQTNATSVTTSTEERRLIPRGAGRGRVCPYLRTINRNLLDFDFEKLCSISMSNLHVYACLVCGVYFQGIGRGTYAYTHALEKNHYVFINLETCKTCCLPENYEIEDASLNDIKYFLKPTYSIDQVEYICRNSILGKSLDGADFFPGFVGLNNLKHTDYCNVIIQLVCSIIPLRNFFLVYENKKYVSKNIVSSLSELIKKIFNPRNFKGVVSPHEFLQTVGIESKKTFKIGSKNDPLDFFLWLISKIHRHEERALRKSIKGRAGKKRKISQGGENAKGADGSSGGQNKGKEEEGDDDEEEEGKIQPGHHLSQLNAMLSSSSESHMSEEAYDKVNIIDYCFDGELIIRTKKKKKKKKSSEGDENTSSTHNAKKGGKNDAYNERNAREDGKFSHHMDNEGGGEDEISNSDEEDNEDLPDGEELNEEKNYVTEKIPFRTLSLKLPNPPIFKSTTESNIIPQVSIFELLTKFDGETESFLNEKSEPSTLIISKLPKYLIFTIKRFSKNNFFVEKNGTIVNFVIKNLDMKDYVHEDYLDKNPVTKYNLIANIFHSGSVNSGTYKIHVLNQASNEWYEMEDLHVITVLPQLVLLPESCVQLYQRQDVQLNGEVP
ncbi:Ubiquitin Carboxyl-terminal Hydrolase-like zinc finger protein [Plasmodium coatneyi]|uniref:Ubiquitin Carboxyl-terminal Hydrolase-like zinc finger protein n=1 Tax=Plasmodium coatneyi TaxID=208452 RepID=A0A1B1E3S0_9APIC|nr:Ubiquitin Carboxyl-terminal Hydrolase-like zinc finger protein [Plasmodium coatneyi]ANQ09459.1 Ubiquitin Carboxyl-terminal Hydrolase-like zinc finger protein [Plasmodium coatneyi]